MVNFSPSEEQELLRQTLADFAREALRPHLRESDEKNVMPPELPAKAWELGLVQESIPEAHGGFGGTRSAVSGALVLEELAYGGLALALHLLSPRLVTVPLLVAGTEAQRAQWLPKFAGAQFTVGTAAVVEPRWDFDASHPATRAERNGGDWVLTGEKCFVPLADRAEVVLVYASTADGLAAFLVERGLKGLGVGEREKNMGVKALETFPVTLDGVRVPAAARLGGDGADLTAAARRQPRRERRGRGGRGPGGVRLRSRVRQGAQGLRRGDRAEAGDRVHAVEHGDRDRLHAAAHLGGGLAARPGAAGHARGRPRPAVRRRPGAQDRRQRAPGAGRPRLHP